VLAQNGQKKIPEEPKKIFWHDEDWGAWSQEEDDGDHDNETIMIATITLQD
jgi:hypothetical protein